MTRIKNLYSTVLMLILLIYCLLEPLGAQNNNIIAPKTLSNRIANYDISANLNTETKIVRGKMSLVWRNSSSDTITELRFHAYLNAFKNNRSTFMLESGGQLRGVSNKPGDAQSWGWIDVEKMRIKDGIDLTRGIKYIQPDDNNEHDQTVFSVMLGDSLYPGKSITLQIDFVSKLPEIFARTGFANNFFMVAQWFPKIGVYEPTGMRGAKQGQWNCHQFHAHSEFYADFGVYNVDITLPENYEIGATGLYQKEKANGNGSKTVYFTAEDVVDFAWTASPEFKVFEDQWNDVLIRVLMQPEHKRQADRYLESLKFALAYFDKNLGKYPYPSITVVDPPFKGFGAGGMEYPMLITAGTFWSLPDGLRFPEIVTVHEFAHNYFMGILASNEFEEAWLDEGITSYYETRIMNSLFTPGNSQIDFMGIKIGDFEAQRNGYVYSNNPRIAEMARPAWGFEHGGYGMLSYNKPATWLTTLERMIGTATMDEVMQTYYERWKFKHPGGLDFIDVANEVVTGKFGDRYGENLNWFFEQAIYGTQVVDYKLARIRNTVNQPDLGIFEKNGKKIHVAAEDRVNKSKKYTTKVEIHRLGDFKIPIEVLIRFEDGTEKLEKWNGQAQTHDFSYQSDVRIISAQIDPKMRLPMDVNLTNNSITLDKKKAPVWKYVVKFLYVIQNIFQFFGTFA